MRTKHLVVKNPLTEALFAITGRNPPTYTRGIYASEELGDRVLELQDWCCLNARPSWSTGIAILEAADAIVKEAVSNGNIAQPCRPNRTHWAIFGARVEEVAVLPCGLPRFVYEPFGIVHDGSMPPYVLTIRHHGRHSYRMPCDVFESFEHAMEAWQDCNRELPLRHRKVVPTVVHLSNHEAFLFAGVYRKTSIDDGVRV